MKCRLDVRLPPRVAMMPRVLTAGALQGEVVVVAPSEVDLAGGPILAERIARAFALRPHRVVVDFAGVSFCDSVAVEVLLHAASELRRHGCVLEVRSPGRHLRRVAAVLELCVVLGVPAPD